MTTQCAACGFDWRSSTDDAIAIIETCSLQFRDLIGGSDPIWMRTRPVPTTWSALEYTAHTRDALGWYHDRMRRILDQPNAQLESFDWDAATESRDYNAESTAAALDTLDEVCVRLAVFLRVLSEA